MSTRIASPRELKAHQSAKLESPQALRKLGVGIPSLLKADLKCFSLGVCSLSMYLGMFSDHSLGGEKGSDSRAKGETMAISGCHIPGEGHLT